MDRFNIKHGRFFSSMLALAAIMFLTAPIMSQRWQLATYIPIAVVACVLIGWTVLAAVYGSRTAITLYFGVLLFITASSFRHFEITSPAASLDWQSMMKFTAWLGAGVIGIVHMPYIMQLIRNPIGFCWLAYIVVAFASCIISPNQVYGLGTVISLTCLFMFSFAVIKYLSEQEILWTVLISFTVLNIGGWLAYYFYPELGISQGEEDIVLLTGTRMAGLAGQPNNLGEVCAIAIGMAFLLWYRKRGNPLLCFLLGGFAVVTLLKSNSRTSEIAAIVGIYVVMMAGKPRLLLASLLATMGILLTLQMFPQIGEWLNSLQYSLSRYGNSDEFTKLSGRTDIWRYAWERIIQSPMLGYGYSSGRIILAQDNQMFAHNLYLQNLLSVGIIGTTPLIIILLYLTCQVFKHSTPFIDYMLTAVLVQSITESITIGDAPGPTTIMFFIATNLYILLSQPRYNLPNTERAGKMRTMKRT